mmetsp:Transcript_5106/g.5802  ORF Transcript_5106/g.5802 Transcript_5106/m.5802 type:complete len:208 (-) Transcript_5106:170-793(-)
MIIENLTSIRAITDENGNNIYRDYAIWTTGHSLGGALAQLLAYTLAGSDDIDDLPTPITAITYASPPVGNYKFRKSFQNYEMKGYLRHIRITAEGDIIPGFVKQTGVSVHLYQDRQAKIKYGKKINYKRRTLKAMVSRMVKNHDVDTYYERLLFESNRHILMMNFENLYEESGATDLFRKRSNRFSVFKKTFKSMKNDNGTKGCLWF